MHPNTKFALAIYAVALAKVAQSTAGGRTVTSEQLAEGANKNPVVVRRLLGPLRDAGLLTSQPGPGGGWRLSRPAAEITLCDIYRALEMEPLFAMPEQSPDTECPLGKQFPNVLMACFREAEQAMEARLAGVTVADIVDSVSLVEGRSCETEEEAKGFVIREYLRANERANNAGLSWLVEEISNATGAK
jgi:Rrf2 family protein